MVHGLWCFRLCVCAYVYNVCVLRMSAWLVSVWCASVWFMVSEYGVYVHVYWCMCMVHGMWCMCMCIGVCVLVHVNGA